MENPIEPKPEPNPNPNQQGQLVLHNKLGSNTEVSNSVVGANGTIVSNAIFKPGKFGNGFYISNDNDYITFPPSTLSDWSKFTAEMWLKPDWSMIGGTSTSDGIDHSPFLMHEGSSLDYISLYFHQNGVIIFALNADSGNCAVYEDTLDITAEQWYHYAIVADINGIAGTSDKMRLYIDGNMIKAISEYYVPGSFIIYVGIYDPANPDNLEFEGIIDNLKIYNYAKTDFSDRNSE